MQNNVRAIAFYLPQFYPTPENDEWWEPGFTEWTNTVRAKPLFRGHYQPRIPRDLGFYDLRVPETREKQAQLAHESGIEGFCYWHYWFDGRQLLDRVFQEVVETGKPDFPFCLCWANHSWYRKTWHPTKPNKLLIEQTYPGKQDYINHFYALLPAFKDTRYLKADGRLIFGIFDSDRIPDFNQMRDIWNRLAVENGLPHFYFFGLVQGKERLQEAQRHRFDTLVYEHMLSAYYEETTHLKRLLRSYFHIPITLPYSTYVDKALDFFKHNPSLTPCIIPNFDHTPRSEWRWVIMTGSTPKEWHKLCKKTKQLLMERRDGEKLLFIKAWNEWGEGNYLEPDTQFGNDYLYQTARALKQ